MAVRTGKDVPGQQAPQGISPQDARSPHGLEAFLGRWHLRRSIIPTTGPAAEFEGAADWRPAAQGGSDYLEKGIMTLAGQTPMQAERRYYWSPDLRVYFDDGRFFHQVPIGGGAVSHWCAPDRYDGTYDFSGWPEFRITWEVHGPRKDYRSVSVYRRE